MGRRGLRIGIGIGPVDVSGRVGGRRRRQYRPGVHPMKQDSLLNMFREMGRRRAQRG
jgi:hypothetical protein